MNDKFFSDYYKLIKLGLESVNYSDLIIASDLIKKISTTNNKLIVMGNGGSAAMSSHVTVDFTKAAGVRAINFNEADLLTCFANDYGYEKVFEKAIEFYADAGDLVILISSSGSSKNVLNAAKRAKELKMPVITFSGFNKNNPLRQLGDINFWVDSKAYNVVEMVHHTWLLSIADFIIGNIYYSAN